MMKMCPRCGNVYSEPSALSRKDNMTEICSACGIIEAVLFSKKLQDERIKQEDESKIYTAYSRETDITFIMEDKGKTTRVVGFYYGEPDPIATEKFYGKLVAYYE